MDFVLFSSSFFCGGVCWFAKMLIFERISFASSSRCFLGFFLYFLSFRILPLSFFHCFLHWFVLL